MTTLSEVRTIPLEDFFRNDEKTSFQISPLGGYISYMASHQNRMNIYVQKVGEDNATSQGIPGKTKIVFCTAKIRAATKTSTSTP